MMNTPPSPIETFGLRFSLVARRWRQTLDAQLTSAGQSDARWVPLVHLEHAGTPLTLKDLAARVGVDASTLVRVIDIHVREGLIERQPDKRDGRSKRLVLTKHGHERVREIRRDLLDLERELLAGLSDDDLNTMLGFLEHIDTQLTDLRASDEVTT